MPTKAMAYCGAISLSPPTGVLSGGAHKTKSHVEGLSSRQTGLLKEVNRICLQHRSAHLLGNPCAYCDLRAAEVRALEALHIAHAGCQFFFESVGLG